ncbi:MAG: transketolase [Hyphomicrobiales bacterium]|nr:transketolase [Hyphomicrobiales bacterium]
MTESERLFILRQLESKVLWLSSWMIHNANHLRSSRDGLKVGGHQASSASVATLMTALFFDVLKSTDRVAVKPHASPVFHAIQYLLGHQSRENLDRFRAFGGAQSYPSRTKDSDDVDFSTGSVGLGVAMTTFASLAQDYVRLKGLAPDSIGEGRMVAIMGDAELDEGNVFEAMLEGWKHDVRNLWWIIDYNRQSLDSIVRDRLYTRIDQLFAGMGWDVQVLKYGGMLEAAFERPGGGALRSWIDDCPNDLYAALTFKGGGAWRQRLKKDLGAAAGIPALLDDLDDDALSDLMTNLGGNDLETALDAFRNVDDDRPVCFIAYTIKGHGLPFAGHKDNHAGLMNPEQMTVFQKSMKVPAGLEWDRYAGLDVEPESLDDFLAKVPFARAFPRRYKAEAVPVPDSLVVDVGERASTQEGFGKILNELGRSDLQLADHIVTCSPDVTVSTNLGGWVNRRGIFDRRDRPDVFRHEKVVSAQSWNMSEKGQHIELGIAENNLFTLLAALGLTWSLFGARLVPIATLYDPFIQRGLDALNYACYQDSRFIVVATPSGVALAPEGGAHQSISSPLIGMAQDGLAAFEPAFVDELSSILCWACDYLQRDGVGQSDTNWLRDLEGGSVYLRLSTRTFGQPARTIDDELHRQIIDGGYWLVPPAQDAEIAIVYTGAVAPEAIAAHRDLQTDVPGAGLFAVTSADRLNAGWHAAAQARKAGKPDARAHVERLLARLAPTASFVTALDGHPATLEWMGAVFGHRVEALGVEHFGQSGDIDDLYRHHRIDADAILDACARGILSRLGP